MRKAHIYILLVLLTQFAKSQSLSPKVTPSAGGFAIGSGVSLSFTIGETIISTLDAGNYNLAQGQQQPEINLLVNNVLGEVCAGEMIVVTFSANSYLSNANEFTLQLSDHNGDFANPIILSTLGGTQSGSITGIIPQNTINGSGYKVRVVSNQPYFVGASLGVPSCSCISPSVAHCPADITVNTAQNLCSNIATYVVAFAGRPEPSVAYTFTGASMGGGTGTGSGAVFSPGITNVVVTATNDCGNETCSFKVTVLDNQLPTISCPASATVTVPAGQCSAAISYTMPTTTDNCGSTVSLVNGFASGTVLNVGLYNMIWQATDASGNATTCSFFITVRDDQAPALSCPANISIPTGAGMCTAVVNYTVSGSDNCPGWSLLRTSGLASGSQFPVGETTVIWKNTDSAGNSTNCSFKVTVTDAQLPTINCPTNITTNTTTGMCSAVVNYTTPTAADNCTTVVVSQVSGGSSGSAFNKGVNVLEWKATDGANNTKACTFSITVNDTQAPVITCPANITANTATGTCVATVNFNNANATDNCTPPPTVTQTDGSASGSSFARGIHTITFRATDGVGLTKTCTLRITVVDNVLPTINCPANIVKNTDNNACSSITTYMVTGADNCTSVSVSRLSGFASGAAFPRGSNTVIWRATDLAGNSTLCSFTVTVNDAQLPTITCPINITTTTTTGQCNKVVNYTTPSYSDNCAGGSISLFSGLASGSVFSTGTNTVVWRAIDNGANSTTCSFAITVTDNELPVITCPPNTTVSGSGSPCGYPASQLNTATATDNCAVTSLTSNASATLPAGPTVVTWTAKDAANNASACSYTVTVNCGSSAGARDEERYEVEGMKYEARTSLHSLIPDDSVRAHPHPSSLTLFPNPASETVVIMLSNQHNLSRRGINPDHSSGQALDHSSGQALDHSSGQASNKQLIIHDALGRQVWCKTLAQGVEQIKIDLKASKFTDGLYQITLRTDDSVVTKSLVVTKR